MTITPSIEIEFSRLLLKAMESVRKNHFARLRKFVDSTKPVIYFEETNTLGKPFEVPLVILRTAPCRWFRSGGCVMCNYELMAVDEGVDDEIIIQQLVWAIDNLPALKLMPYLFLTSQGSFFDEHEIPSRVRQVIASRLKSEGLKSMATESEAKYCVNNVQISDFVRTFGGHLSIGIGLEAANETIRNCIINKGLSDELYYAAANFLKSIDVSHYAYITVGKPFLSIQEDIDDAVEAIELSSKKGAFMHVVEMTNIQPFTLTEALFRLRLYSPPSLWTAFAVMRRLSPELRARTSVKGFDANIEPNPIALSNSCEKCSDQLRNAFRVWNLTREWHPLNKLWGICECFKNWESLSEQQGTETVHLRLHSNLDTLRKAIDYADATGLAQSL